MASSHAPRPSASRPARTSRRAATVVDRAPGVAPRRSSSDGSWLRIRPCSSRSSSGRLEAELVVERAAEVLVDRERVGVPPGPVEREHRLPAQALAQREPRDLGRQLPDQLRVAALHQVRLDAVLETGQAQLVEMIALGLREGLGELGERLAAPEPERLAQVRGGGRRLAGLERRAARAAQPVEAHDVDRLRVDLDEVAGRAREEHVGRQQLAQLRDVDLDHLRRRVGHGVAPEVVDEAVDRDRAVGRHEQPGQQRPLLEAAERERRAAVEHLHRAEQAELHSSARRYQPSRRPATASGSGYAGAGSGSGRAWDSPTSGPGGRATPASTTRARRAGAARPAAAGAG